VCDPETGWELGREYYLALESKRDGHVKCKSKYSQCIGYNKNDEDPMLYGSACSRCREEITKLLLSRKEQQQSVVIPASPPSPPENLQRRQISVRQQSYEHNYDKESKRDGHHKCKSGDPWCMGYNTHDARPDAFACTPCRISFMTWPVAQPVAPAPVFVPPPRRIQQQEELPLVNVLSPSQSPPRVDDVPSQETDTAVKAWVCPEDPSIKRAKARLWGYVYHSALPRPVELEAFVSICVDMRRKDTFAQLVINEYKSFVLVRRTTLYLVDVTSDIYRYLYRLAKLCDDVPLINVEPYHDLCTSFRSIAVSDATRHMLRPVTYDSGVTVVDLFW